MLYGIPGVSMLDSHNYNEGDSFGFKPFKFGDKNAPSEFYIRFIIEGIEHEYSFTCTHDEIITESLYYYPKGRRALISGWWSILSACSMQVNRCNWYSPPTIPICLTWYASAKIRFSLSTSVMTALPTCIHCLTTRISVRKWIWRKHIFRGVLTPCHILTNLKTSDYGAKSKAIEKKKDESDILRFLWGKNGGGIRWPAAPQFSCAGGESWTS